MSHEKIVNILLETGKAVRMKVLHSLHSSSTEQLSAVFSENKEDTIYQIDRDVEDVIVPVISKYAAETGGIVLLAEGIGQDENGLVFPPGMPSTKAAWRFIIDPIDGTRGIMYNKRSAFFLAGAAPNHGVETRLSDIEVACMVELPTTKQFLADTLWAVKGKGWFAERDNTITNEREEIRLRPSSAKTIIGGFAQFSRFFPPGRDLLSRIEDELIHTIQPDNPSGKALVFEDQYICSGGQLYEMLAGHDRFVADIRGILYRHLSKSNVQPGHVCHPYDVCAHLIGKEAGLVLTDGFGKPFDAAMDLNTEVNWIGYANEEIRREVEPIIAQLFRKYELWGDGKGI